MCPLEPKQHAQPELQLLLACARAQLNPAAAVEIASAAGEPLDWLLSDEVTSIEKSAKVLNEFISEIMTAAIRASVPSPEALLAS